MILLMGQHNKTILYFLHDKSMKFGIQTDDYTATSLVMAISDFIPSPTSTHCQYYYQYSYIYVYVHALSRGGNSQLQSVIATYI